MALPKVTVSIESGKLGAVTPTNDSVAGLIVSGIALTDLALNTPKKITSLKAAEDIGINAAYDTTNSVHAHKHIKNFFAQAGTGAELWIMIVATTVAIDDMVDKTIAANAVKLLDAASGTIRLLGVTRDPTGYTPTYTEEIEDDILQAVINAQALAEEYQSNWKPLVILIEGRNWQGTVGSKKDFRTGNDDKYVSVVIGSDESSGNYAFVGLVLGRLAKIPVQRSIGRVRDGDIDITKAYFSDGSTVEAVTETNQGTLHDSGYIFARKHVGLAGYYFNFDNNCNAPTDDFNSISRVRVIEKARLLAYKELLKTLNDEIPVDADSGKLNAAFVKELQGGVENALSTMISEGNAAAVACTIDETQNVLSTDKIIVNIEVTPVGVAKTIEATVKFNNPFNS